MSLRNIEQRLDRQAIHQLRAEVVRLNELVEQITKERDEAEQRARWAEDSANFWEDVAKLEHEGREVGITQDGHAVVIDREQVGATGAIQ